MITAEGYRQRRLRLWQNLDPKPPKRTIFFTDPIHLALAGQFPRRPDQLIGRFRLPDGSQGRPRPADPRQADARER